MQYAIHPTIVRPDEAVVELSYTRVVNVHTMDKGKEHKDWIADTKHPDSRFIDQQILEQGIGRPFRATVSSRGEVTADTAQIKAQLDRILEAVESEAVQSPDGPLSAKDRAYAIDQIRQRFGVRATATTLTQIFSIYPSATVGERDCWKQPWLLNFTTHDSVQWLKADRSSCLRSVGKAEQSGVVKEVFVVNDTAPILTVTGNAAMTDVMRMSGTQNGTSVIVAETGWPMKLTTSLHYDGKHHFQLKKADGIHRFVVLYTIDSTSETDVKVSGWTSSAAKAKMTVKGDGPNGDIAPTRPSEVIDDEGPQSVAPAGTGSGGMRPGNHIPGLWGPSDTHNHMHSGGSATVSDPKDQPPTQAEDNKESGGSDELGPAGG